MRTASRQESWSMMAATQGGGRVAAIDSMTDRSDDDSSHSRASFANEHSFNRVPIGPRVPNRDLAGGDACGVKLLLPGIGYGLIQLHGPQHAVTGVNVVGTVPRSDDSLVLV
jgi:hypothetical protein